jgi:Icc-related predicted phosphoesterase
MTLMDTVKIAAVGDLHITKSAQGALSGMLTSVTEQADVLVLCGDLTDYGLPEEAKLLAKELTTYVKIPIVAVLGNHDHESGLQGEVKNILTASGVKVLDGEATEVLGIGFAGTKGFCGGFSRWTLGSWGEELIKKFVHEAVEESLKLESALARLRTPQRIAVLHYSPIPATVQGEPLEIYPFLGTSRLEEPLSRHPVTVVFHGHAHSGTMEGKTVTGTPVYNVAMPLLRKMMPNQPAYRIVELPVSIGPVPDTVPAAH